MPGSSPLARGALGGLGGEVAAARIIPARAGCTSPAPSTRPARPDHPRSRGVHSSTRPTRRETPGSSPLARGARVGDDDLAVRLRIIPARAGCTPPRASVPNRSTDHPRSRGVHPTDDVRRSCGCGSSPLARGAHRHDRRLAPPGRIIPARAGCTRSATPPTRSSADHPRSRGVHFGEGAGVHGVSGSSPLARGARGGGQGRATDGRDHPRSRGVHISVVTEPNSATGSSPLARGARRSRLDVRAGPRIIPARAGCTLRKPDDSNTHDQVQGRLSFSATLAHVLR